MKVYVGNIHPGNEALNFIDRRIDSPLYRGNRSSQHNRYDMKEIHIILVLLNKYAPNCSLLRIRDTDTKKRPENTPDEIQYARFCENVKASAGKGTQDSIRKNIFVDLHRMGLIERYDSKKEPIDAFSRVSPKYVSLSADGLKFVNENNLLNQSFLFTKAINNLLGGYIDISLELLKSGSAPITELEFMFFVSAVDADTDFSISLSECADLIKSFRLLSRLQQKLVADTLKRDLIPGNFNGNKTKQRDWHNWKNKIDQVFHLFNQSPYFDICDGVLSLSTHKIKTRQGDIIDVMTRSITAKNNYFEKHKVNKTPGYELHHVVPLSWAESPEQYKLFDKWENMVYIDAYRHALITQNRNRNIFMNTVGDDIILADSKHNEVVLSYDGKNILYCPDHKRTMVDYNKSLIQTV